VRCRVALWGAVGQIAVASAGHGAQITLVALSDDPAPDGAPGATWAAFYDPVINDAGAIAFGAYDSTAYGIWRFDASGWERLAGNGDPAPGVNDGAIFAPDPPGGLGPPRLDEAGRLRVDGRLAAPGGGLISYPRGLWWAQPGAPLDLLVRENEVGTTSGQYAFNEVGDTLFTTDFGHVWRANAAGDPTLLIQWGLPFAGAPAGTTFGGASPNTGLSINDAGAIAFHGTLGGSATLANDRAVFAAAPGGAVNLVAREGDPVPGIAGAVYGDSIGIALDGSSRTILRTQLKIGVGGVTSANDEVIYGPAAIGSHTPLLREGDPAPGLPAGARIGSGLGILLNDAGDTFVSASLIAGEGGVTAETDQAIWRVSETGNFTMIARKGDLEVDLPDGARLTLLGSITPNDVGGLLVQTLFTPTLWEPEPDPNAPPPLPETLDEAFFYASPEGGPLQLLLKEGDRVEVAPGVFRTVGTIFYDYDEAFNDLGQFVVNAYFLEGGSSVLLISIPEPASALLLAIGLVALGARRRMR
jgi:hypothetical protein